MKYRCDENKVQADGGIVWYAIWGGGQTLAKVENCRLIGLEGNMRRSVQTTGEPDTYFSIPAKTRIGETWIKGYLSQDDDQNLVFHHCYY